LDLVQRSVAGSDDCDWTGGHGRTIDSGQVAEVTKRLKSLDDVWPSGRTVGLDVDKKIESLSANSVVDAVLGRASDKWRGWILAFENVNEWVDVE